MTEAPAFASRTLEAAGEARVQRELVFVVPGRLDQLTGGYLFDGHIVEGLRARGRAVRVIELAARDPRADAAVLAAVADGTPTVVDGLVLANLGEVAAAHARRLRLVALVHGPLAHETGLSPVAAKAAEEREAALLLRLRGILCASRKTATAIRSYGVDPDRIAIAPPGTAKPNQPPRSRRAPVRALLCVGNLVPLKGHGVLVAALVQLRDLDWTLLCIGSVERDRATADAVRQAIAEAALERRILLAGERAPADVAAAYRAADAFVLPSFHEGYGMVYAEAMANGLPVIATIAGSIPEIVPPSAGLLVPPGDPAALARAVRRVIADPRLATRLAAGSREAGARFPDWPRAIADWEAAFDRLVSLPPPS
jgi:glycosyltransferase involved in cell wall biosynthesis